MNKIYFEEGQNYHIKNDDDVSIIKFNATNKIKIKNCSKRSNNLNKFKKISVDEYVDVETGEILKYTKYKYKTKSAIGRSMNKLNDILLNNFDGGDNEIFLTLSYENKEEDYNKTASDLGDFWKDLKKEFQDLKFIGVIENQELRDSWHIHMLIKDTKHKKLYIPSEEIERIWNKGFVYVSRITNKNINNIINGSAAEKKEGTAIIKVINYMCKSKSKEKIPSGKKSYFKSNNIKYPTIDKMTYTEAQKVLDDNNCYLLWEKTVLVRSNDTNSILNKIKTEIYEKE